MADPLPDLLAQVRACRACADDLPHEPRPVLQASPTARLLIVGQAPGTRVHESGRPFTDPSGDRLRDWLGIGSDIFYDETKVAIVPMGFCFPGLNDKGADLPPMKRCAPLWRDQVMASMPNVKLTLVIGQYAQGWHLKGRKEKSVTATVENWKTYRPDILPLPHPIWRNNAWIKKHSWFEADLLPYLRRRVKAVLK